MKAPLDKSVYLICGGEDEFRVDYAARELIDALVPKNEQEFGLEKIDGRVENVETTLEMLRNVRDTLFANDLFGSSDKTVWLLEPSFLTVDRISKSESIKNALAPFIDQIKEGLPQGSRLVISTTKINRAQAFYKACVAKGHVIDFGSNMRQRDKEQNAQVFIAEWAPKVGIKLDPKVAQALVARTGTETRQLLSELNKLACYCGNRKEVAIEDVNEITTVGAVSEIWDFTDAFASRSKAKLMLQIRKQLDQGENAIRLVSSLLTCVSSLLFVRDAIDRGWAVGSSDGILWKDMPPDVDEGLALAEKDIRKTLSGFRAKKTFEQACLWKTSELRAARHHLLTLREALVSCQIPEESLLTFHLIRALGSPRKPTNSRKL